MDVRMIGFWINRPPDPGPGSTTIVRTGEMTKHFANCVCLLAFLVAHGTCQTQPFACDGQFPGPGGCLNQHLRISDVIYSPYDNVAFGRVDGFVKRE